MKALRIFSFVAFLALGSAIAPQTASAFTYYVTLVTEHNINLKQAMLKKQSTSLIIKNGQLTEWKPYYPSAPIAEK